MSGSVFVRRLEAFAKIDEADRKLLQDALTKTIDVYVKRPFVRDGYGGAIHVVLSGMACRIKTFGNGRRQISALLIPGDLYDPHLPISMREDYAVTALDRCTLAEVSPEDFSQLLDRPEIARGLKAVSLVEQSILSEWIGNIGQRNALERMAHLFCEIYFRMEAVGMADGNIIGLPLTQTDLADSLGLSLVHTNKSLRALRDRKIVEFRRKELILLDIDLLARTCGFDASYLRL